jgi:hypothetical protein
MASRDVIPSSDNTFDTFQDNLYDKVTTNMSGWNIPQAAIDVLTPLKNAWDNAWDVAKVKTNRTATQVATKNLARKNYVKALRPFIQAHIYNNSAMSNDDIVECDLRPRDTVRTPVPVPTSVPVINIMTASGNIGVIRFFRLDDEDGAIRRGKPKGVARIEFASNVDVQPANPNDCSDIASATKSPMRVEIDPADRGKKLWFYARWINTREQPGPWTDLEWYIM